MRILLVEDDEKLNQSLAFQLKDEGFLTDSCRDGEEALYYIGEHIHDLILLDRMLPRISGTEVLRQMREAGDQTPVILITALGTLDDKVTGLDLGADDYLVKPFAFEELMARIRCVTRRPRQLLLNEQLTLEDLIYHVEEGNLDNYIHFLRRRLKTVGSSVRIQTVRGIGYRID